MSVTIERARSLVAQYTAGGTSETREAIAQRVAGGECVWHAAAQVTGKQCYCAVCDPRPFAVARSR